MQRTKLEQRCGLLSKQSNTYNNLGIALKRQSDKQLEQIRKLEEREKSLQQQLQTVERELAARTTACDAHQQKVAVYMRQLTDLKEKVAKAGAKYDNMSTILKKKTESVDSEADKARRAQEHVDVLKKKVEVLQKQETSVDSSLQKQVDQYKLLLKCSSCNDKFKSHVLLKCMHTFCKDCIDDMYASRQRKCPTCATAFARTDIREVYL
ncbi:hypothetical protein BDK51DRAFT_23150 [Blyttiomyces helicus]|uniref:E3 ubiquitin protein ligase n=1 Tax=Blyttiomyces helicus TaxID=388810 RepID=A0A4P9WBK3_9FUNG|nr:hypothetical protein BDK51DRAFT_23150 [Blyttiomyces helicus]|eukprot:RKO89642.1 hypothetical protein BDK51DRAFT_23150 [Blyttiomyces helicus]